jgi:Icc protein
MASPSTCIQFLPGSDGFAVDTTAPGYRWLSLHADGRIETGVQRLSEIPGTLDLASAGY